MKEKIMKLLKKYTIVLVMLGLILLFSSINPVFFSITNITNIFVQQSYVIIAAIGLSFVMISGGMDLSIGYQMSLVGVITAICIMWFNMPVALSIFFGLITGILLGLINGVAAVKLKVHPFIVDHIFTFYNCLYAFSFRFFKINLNSFFAIVTYMVLQKISSTIFW